MDLNKLTYLINDAIFEVNSELGAGFLEKVYVWAAPFPLPLSAEEKVCVRLCGSVAD